MKIIIFIYSISISYRGYNYYQNTKLNSNSSKMQHITISNEEVRRLEKVGSFGINYDGSKNSSWIVDFDRIKLLDLPKNWSIIYVRLNNSGNFIILINGMNNYRSSNENIYIDNNRLIGYRQYLYRSNISYEIFIF
nr:MAG TPA: hypothetical protein [Caudoviricetes sp.]